MSKCIMHIGMHKTGSSSIQSALSRHLEDSRFRYLDLGLPNHSLPLFTVFSHRIHHLFQKEALTKQQVLAYRENTIRRLSHECESSRNNNAIALISGEDICNLTHKELSSFHDYLKGYFDTIDVVAYVRTPKSFMESAFQQRLKGGLSRFNIDSLYPSYRERFEKFENVFGQACLKYWLFEEKGFEQGDVVRDFYYRLGIAFKPKDSVRVNASLSKEAVALLFIYRRLGPGYVTGEDAHRKDQLLVTALGQVGKGKLELSTELMRAVLEKNSEDIAWMECRLGVPFNDELGNSDLDNVVATEEDLLNVSGMTITELNGILRANGVLPVASKEPRDLAKAIHRLLLNLRARRIMPKEV